MLLALERDDGFTLIEIITVMIIIAVLAAIAIPIFLDQQNRAHDAAAKSDLNSISKGILTELNDGQTTEPTMTVSGTTVSLDGEEIASLSPGVVLGSLHWVDNNDWCIDATQPHGDRANITGYKYDTTEGSVDEGQCV